MSFLNFSNFNIERLLSAEGIIFLLGKLCLIIGVGLSVWIGNLIKDISDDSNSITAKLADISSQEDNKEKKSLDAFNLITTRNIFGEVEGKKDDSAAAKKSPDIELRLVATNVSKNGLSLAIIENKKKKKQDVFEIGEEVFDYAKLEKVTETEITLNKNGTIETLVLEKGKSGSSNSNSGSISDDQTDFSVDEEELESALNNLPKLLSQARAVPYFRNGKSIGMRLFAIRAGSLYEKIGLKNGDILTAVNENTLADPTQALKLFEQLKTEREIQVSIERNGGNINLNYSIE